MAFPKRTDFTCTGCGKTAEHKAKNLCSACYQRQKPKTPRVRAERICSACKELRPYKGNGLCTRCHQTLRPSKQKSAVCTFCKESQPIYAKGLCARCYDLTRYHADPERFRAKARQRWTRLQEARSQASHTEEEWQALQELFGHRCAYCGVDIKGSALKDHAVPISDPESSDDISNILPCCATCNLRKGTKSVAEYLRVLARDKRGG